MNRRQKQMTGTASGNNKAIVNMNFKWDERTIHPSAAH